MDGKFGLGQPHSSRMYDYFLGGKDNYEADRLAAAEVLKVWPGIRTAARANRQFMQRSTRFLVDVGVRQFLDIGTGIPTEPNLHQIAQRGAAESRVVYVDNDPLVLAHARALMTGSEQGATTYIHGDVTEPKSILQAPELTEVLDLDKPIGLSMIALLHFVDTGTEGIMSAFIDALAPGSYLVICTATADFDPEQVATARAIYRARGITAQDRTRDEITALFSGLDLVEPGIVPPHRWRADQMTEVAPSYDADVSCYSGVARKP